MHTTRTHAPTMPKVTVNDDGSIEVEVNDQIVRTHTSGRYKGTIEHTTLRLLFVGWDALSNWLDAVKTGVTG